MNEESRPKGRPSEEVAAAAKPPLILDRHSSASADNPASLAVLPLRWARALIEAADGPIPPYGSAEWSALPDDNRAKVAACVQAAERDRTRLLLSENVLFTAGSGGTRARRIAEACRPRPGDYTGGPVPWERDEVAAGE